MARPPKSTEGRITGAQRLDRMRESALSRPAGSLREAISRVPQQMGRNLADRVSQEFGTLGSATIAAIRTPGARTAAFGKELSIGIRSSIASALGGGQVGRYLADKIRGGIRYDKDPQKNFERMRGLFQATNKDMQQIKGSLDFQARQFTQLRKKVDDLAIDVNRIKNEQSVQQRLIDQLKQAAEENKGRSSALKQSTAGSVAEKKPSSTSSTSIVDTAVTVGATAGATAAAGGVIYKLQRIVRKLGVKRSVQLLARKMGYRAAASLVGKLFAGAVGGAVSGGIITAIMVAWTLKDLNDAIEILNEAAADDDGEDDIKKVEQLIQQEERQRRQETLTGKGRLTKKYKDLISGNATGRRPTTATTPQVNGKQSSVSLNERFARYGTNMEKQQFLAYGQLPRGFENIPGHMGILGSPGAVMARGVMPLGQYGGGGVVGGYGGMPSVSGGGSPGGGYSAPSSSAAPSSASGERTARSGSGLDKAAVFGEIGKSELKELPKGDSAWLAKERKSVFDELDRNPKLKAFVLSAMMKEDHRDPQLPLEAFANRMAARRRRIGPNYSIQSELKAFFGPIQRGEVSTRNITPQMEEAYRKVKAGSKRIGFLTDQGMKGEHSGRPTVRIGQDYYSQMEPKWGKLAEREEAKYNASVISSDKKTLEPLPQLKLLPQQMLNDNSRPAQPGSAASSSEQKKTDQQSVLLGLPGIKNIMNKQVFEQMAQSMGATPKMIENLIGKGGRTTANWDQIRTEIEKASKSGQKIAFSAHSFGVQTLRDLKKNLSPELFKYVQENMLQSVATGPYHKIGQQSIDKLKETFGDKLKIFGDQSSRGLTGIIDMFKKSHGEIEQGAFNQLFGRQGSPVTDQPSSARLSQPRDSSGAITTQKQLFDIARTKRPDYAHKLRFESRGGTRNCGRGTGAVVDALLGTSFSRGGIGGNAADFANTKAQFGPKGMYVNQGQDIQAYLKDPKQWRIGDVVASRGGGSGNGHIQVWNGKQWVSDFSQGNRTSFNWGNYNGHTLHRLTPQGLQKLHPKTIESFDSNGATAAGLKEANIPIESLPKDGGADPSKVATSTGVTQSSAASLLSAQTQALETPSVSGAKLAFPMPGAPPSPEQQQQQQWTRERPALGFPIKGMTELPIQGGTREAHRQRSSGQHAGLDVGEKIGKPIVAQLDGEVISIRNMQGYGLTADVRYSDGTIHRFAHLNGVTEGLKVGTKLTKGSEFGYVGVSGTSGRWPHLHWEVFKDQESYEKGNRGASRYLAHFRMNPRDWLESHNNLASPQQAKSIVDTSVSTQQIMKEVDKTKEREEIEAQRKAFPVGSIQNIALGGSIKQEPQPITEPELPTTTPISTQPMPAGIPGMTVTGATDAEPVKQDSVGGIGNAMKMFEEAPKQAAVSPEGIEPSPPPEPIQPTLPGPIPSVMQPTPEQTQQTEQAATQMLESAPATATVPTSPQGATDTPAGGGEGNGGGGGRGAGPPNFNNGPSQAPSPGSQGIGSFGRCYLIYEWR